MSMNSKILKKLGRVFFSALPSLSDLSFVIKFVILVLIGATFLTIFNYTSTTHAQSSNLTSVGPSLTRWTQTDVNGCMSFLFSGGVDTSSMGASAGLDGVVKTCTPMIDSINNNTDTSSSGSGTYKSAFLPLDLGPTGRLINATSTTYSTNLAQPGTTVEYYASNISGRVMAADSPTSGRSTLAPVFQLNQVMVNLAYALIVIVLIFSSLSILISSLSGGEEKFTLVQLMINAGITLLIVTFYYEISAIIFDLCVNYGNALVASVLSPYINSYAILDRLSPGGDLGIVGVLNTFQFAGVTDSLLVVSKNIAAGVYPALAQTSAAYQRALALEGIFNQNNSGALNFAYTQILSFGSAQSTIGISAVLNSFLGSSEIIASIVAWTLFIVNLKIFLNLLVAFLSFSITVGFGPLIVLSAVSGGFEKVTESFKNLAATALVFPVTFLLILLGAIAMNVFIQRGVTQGTGDSQRQVLCAYSPSDPQNTEGSIIQGGFEARSVDGGIPLDQSFLSPDSIRAQNFLNQNIFNTTPASSLNGVRDCRSALFPVPWTYIPAPFGSLGVRTLQVQTIDSLVRTFLGIIFLIMAARAPQILEEVMGVKKMGFLDGIGNSFKSGAQSFFGLGATALQISLPIAKFWGGRAMGVGGIASKYIPGMQKFNAFTANIQDKLTGARIARDFEDDPNNPGKLRKRRDKRRGIGDAIGNLTQYDSNLMGRAYGEQQYKDMNKSLIGMGLPADQASLLAGQNLITNFEKISKVATTAGTALQAMAQSVDNVTKMLESMGGQIQKFVLTDIAV